MRFFFRSKKFKIMLSTLAIFVVLFLAAWMVGSSFSPQNSVVGAVTASVSEIVTRCRNWCSDFFGRFEKNGQVMLENASLRAKVDQLTSDLMGYEEAKQENEMYEKYYGIKEQHRDYTMEPAMLISRNQEDPYGSFVINKGSLQGISLHDPVITEAGLVGYISEVNPSFSKVTTILDGTIHCGGMDRRTRDAGVITGEVSLAEQGKTRMNHLLRSSGVATGDYIVTSGGGVFPEGLVIGQVDSVHNESYNTALYAVITPTVDFSELRDMMVITYFSGQGSAAGDDR